MKRLFERESSGILAGLAWAMAGLVIGATAVLLLTPRSGAQMRRLLVSLLAPQGAQPPEEIDDGPERMENEGGIARGRASPSRTTH